ncbi:MAG: DNA-processing protein DprA [Clostridia bacterium]|nr:DNA-processing protein DprA [Clostridia bacterium]
MEKQKLYWLWLTTIYGISNGDITALLEQFDSIEEIYAERDFAAVVNIKPSIKRALSDKSLKRAEKVLEATLKTDTKVLTYDDINYPDSLRKIESPPYGLYVRGEIMNWDRLLSIGVVGTRKCTDYGIAAAKRISSSLAENGVTIVSGMARGIDTVAARAALDAGNKTIAVLGCGTDIVYPPENSGIMQEIIQNGAVISEYPPGSPPSAAHFPWRNRIISGLSRGILVAEAPKKSGALITADYALEQGKDIFAVPGSIFKESCEGTNRLISCCAKAVSSAGDILEEYTFEIERLQIEKPKGIKKIFYGKKKEKVNNEIKLTIDDKRFLGLMDDHRVIIALLIESNLHIDDIKRKSGFDVAKLTSILSMLEFGGFIQKLPGNNYRINLH